MTNFIVYLLLCIPLLGFSQTPENEDVLKFQQELNAEYTDSLKSPLSRQERLNFKGHTFYPVDLSYRVKAALVVSQDEQPFKMNTTKGQPRNYIKYGEVHFVLQGKMLKLNVYQSLDLMKVEKYKTYLFLPFKDLTNSVETYGGGRFIDLNIPEGKSIMIDFNKAYNPFCAYSDLYSCPVTPIENTLNIEVKAGVKETGEHH